MRSPTKALKRAAARVVKVIRGPQSRNQLHEFWRRPDAANQPKGYLDAAARSEFLVDIVKRHVPFGAPILEIGCNVGRNLHYLASAGFTTLAGVEINEDAMRQLREAFPDLARGARLLNEPVESAIRRFRDGEFTLVYTMAVLEHIHPDSEWIFAEMVRIAGDVLITVEDEHGISWRHFARDYNRVFEALGLKERESLDCSSIEGLGPDFRARIFKKPS
jgi:SAM-dependent methyltransferase